MATINQALDMSLDDLISKQKEEQGGRGGERRRGRVDRSRRVRRNEPVFRRDRTISKETSSNRRDGGRAFRTNVSRSTRSGVSVDEVEQWSHDLFEEEGKMETETNNSSTQANNNSASRSIKMIGTKVRISNLSYEASEEDLKSFLSQVGKIMKAVIHYDRSGRSEGSADVYFESRTEAEKCINEFDGKTLKDKKIRVAFPSAADLPRLVISTTVTNRPLVERRAPVERRAVERRAPVERRPPIRISTRGMRSRRPSYRNRERRANDTMQF
jgi:THO complex subunit 4